LKRVAAKHEEPDLNARPGFVASEFPKIFPVNPDQRQGAQQEARRQIAENGNIGEGVLYHDEGHSPKKGAGQQRTMSFESEAHRRRAVRTKSGNRA